MLTAAVSCLPNNAGAHIGFVPLLPSTNLVKQAGSPSSSASQTKWKEESQKQGYRAAGQNANSQAAFKPTGSESVFQQEAQGICRHIKISEVP